MLSREEVYDIERYEAQEKCKWLSLACVNESTLTALCLTASAVLRKPTKERKDKLKMLIKKIHDDGIYTVGTVMENLKE